MPAPERPRARSGFIRVSPLLPPTAVKRPEECCLLESPFNKLILEYSCLDLISIANAQSMLWAALLHIFDPVSLLGDSNRRWVEAEGRWAHAVPSVRPTEVEWSEHGTHLPSGRISLNRGRFLARKVPFVGNQIWTGPPVIVIYY